MNRYQIMNGRELSQITKLGQSLMTLMTGIKTRACPRGVHGYSLTYYYGGELSVECILHVSYPESGASRERPVCYRVTSRESLLTSPRLHVS